MRMPLESLRICGGYYNPLYPKTFLVREQMLRIHLMRILLAIQIMLLAANNVIKFPYMSFTHRRQSLLSSSIP